MTLLDLFDYDHWANRLWLQAAAAMNEEHILAHILVSSQVWLARVKHEEADTRDDLPLELRLQETYAAWRAYLSSADLTKEVYYTNSRGESYTETVEQIAQHVINHGTYHRGQLRGIAGERRMDFPETDLIKYVRDHMPTPTKH